MAEPTTLFPATSEPSAPNIVLPPTQAELPYDDDAPIESPRHKVQIELLIDTLLPWLEQRPDGYIGGNMFVYFSMAQVRIDTPLTTETSLMLVPVKSQGILSSPRPLNLDPLRRLNQRWDSP